MIEITGLFTSRDAEDALAGVLAAQLACAGADAAMPDGALLKQILPLVLSIGMHSARPALVKASLAFLARALIEESDSEFAATSLWCMKKTPCLDVVYSVALSDIAHQDVENVALALRVVEGLALSYSAMKDALYARPFDVVLPSIVSAMRLHSSLIVSGCQTLFHLMGDDKTKSLLVGLGFVPLVMRSTSVDEPACLQLLARLCALGEPVKQTLMDLSADTLVLDLCRGCRNPDQLAPALQLLASLSFHADTGTLSGKRPRTVKFAQARAGQVVIDLVLDRDFGSNEAIVTFAVGVLQALSTDKTSCATVCKEGAILAVLQALLRFPSNCAEHSVAMYSLVFIANASKWGFSQQLKDANAAQVLKCSVRGDAEKLRDVVGRIELGY